MPVVENQHGYAHPLVHVTGLNKSYIAGGAMIELFRNLQLCVAEGELLAIVGESGSGKSTLLHLLAAMDTPASGEVLIAGQNISAMNARQQAKFRNRTIGYVWQFHYLLPEFTAEENVAMPLLAQGVARAKATNQARQWLAEVGLTHRAQHRSGELSGGEQQRVSMARALITQPKLLLADEPTGDLDSRTAETVFSLLERLHRTHGLTSVIVTHHPGLAARCDRTLVLRDGALAELRANTAQQSATADSHRTSE